MSKIVSAVNAMILRQEKIKNVVVGDEGEVFFRYDDKYVWSIAPTSDDVFLWYYPGNPDPRKLSGVPDWGLVEMVTYKASEVGGREARDSFRELYLVVKERLHGVDDVLKDIIDSADDIPF